jgi:hypothetical protein
MGHFKPFFKKYASSQNFWSNFLWKNSSIEIDKMWVVLLFGRISDTIWLFHKRHLVTLPEMYRSQDKTMWVGFSV